MNKTYLIIPVVLLVGFIGVERRFQHQRAEEVEIKNARDNAAKIAAEQDKAEKQRLAAEELKKKQADRERDDVAREEKKQRDFDTLMANPRAQAETTEAEAARLAADVAQFTARLEELRSTRNTRDRETFELVRAVTVQRLEQRSAEMELQRTRAMVASRLEQSAWASPAPAPTPTTRPPLAR